MSSAAVVAGGWRGRLALRYARRGDRTRLVERRHHGPLLVQRPFYPEGPICHSYILHPPGGVVGGDELTLDVQCDEGTHALLTTPAACKFYRSPMKTAYQQQTLKVAGGATLEWLPQEAIWFSGAHAHLHTRVDLAEDARFIGWEAMCLGRPCSAERFDSGYAQLGLTVWRDARPLFVEQLRVAGGGRVLDGDWGLQGHVFSATLVAVNADETILLQLREAVAAERGQWQLTLIGDVLIGRYLGDSADDMHRTLIAAWQLLRPLLLDLPACSPRIWAT